MLRVIYDMSAFFSTKSTASASFDKSSNSLKMKLLGDLKSTTIADLYRDSYDILTDKALSGSGFETLELDITDASMVDSQGLNLIVSLLRQVKTREGKLKLITNRRTVYMTLLSVGLERQAEVVFNG